MYTGAFVTCLEHATGVKATVIGKPEREFFLEALKLVDAAPDRTVMIGDVCTRWPKTGLLHIIVSLPNVIISSS